MALKPTSTSAHQPPDLSSLCLAITEHAPLPMATVEGTSHIVRYVNPAFCRLLDKPSEQLVGIPFCEMLPEKDECVTLLDRVYRTGKSESHTEQQHSKPHPFFWSYTMWPVLADERPVGVMIQVTETAQFHEKTLAMNEALMLGSLRQHEFTEAANSLNTKQQTDERFCGSFKLFRPDGSFMPHEQCPMAEVLSGKIAEARDAEVLIERPDGSRISVAVNIRPLKNQRGEITGAINCAYDITERKRAIAHERLLLNELAHRSQNLLSVVQSIASRTLSGALSLTEARDAFIERLAALSHTQSALIADGFKGATVAA